MSDPADDATYRRIREEAYSAGIGRTPILKIPVKEGVSILAKLEHFNKYRSVKDRGAFFMLKKAQYDGLLNKDRIVVEGTSGNTGIAMGHIARDLGIEIDIIIPPGASNGTKDRLKDTGARVIEAQTDGSPGARVSTANAIDTARKMAREQPSTYYNPFQHGNIANAMAHYYTTGPEVEEATGIVPDYAAIGMGTGGTLIGLSKYLRSRNPDVGIYAVQSDPQSFIQGVRNYERAREKKLISDNISLIDDFITVTEKDAYREVRYLLEHYKIFMGTSSGASLAGARELAKRIDKGNILTVFPDSAEKYRNIYAEKNVFSEDEFDENIRYYVEIPREAITLV